MGSGMYDLAEEQNNLTRASMIESAQETARATAKADAVEANAENAKAAKSETPDLEKALSLSKKKKGVNSTYTATTGAGAGMLEGTSMTPIAGA